MKELTATQREGWKIKSLIESSVIVPTISDLRRKGFQSFIIKTVSTVNPQEYEWEGRPCQLSAN